MQWTDSTVGYFYHFRMHGSVKGGPFCCFMNFAHTISHVTGFGKHVRSLELYECVRSQYSDIVCEKPKEAKLQEPLSFQRFNVSSLDGQRFVSCPAGHMTHRFSSCDRQNACWLRNVDSVLTCSSPVIPLPPMFACSNDIERVPYTLVCDYRPDCNDHSDEQFCVYPSCSAGLFHCGNSQCIKESQKCDFIDHCLNGVDELECDHSSTLSHYFFKVSSHHTPYPPGLVNFNIRGNFTVSPLPTTSRQCPETHFECPGRRYYCLPVYVRCNQVNDCPGREDEMMCESSTCPGFYRCRASSICVHAQHICDGMFQCPQHDDELHCQLICPQGCTCYGHAFFCANAVQLHTYLDLRFLEGKGSKIKPDVLKFNGLLVYLGLALCNLRDLVLPSLKNLHVLDLSDNLLKTVTTDQLVPVKQLRWLKLAGNPLTLRHIAGELSFLFVNLLDMSRISIDKFDPSTLKTFPNLETVNLSNTGIHTVEGTGFQSLKRLRVVDMQGCPLIHFPNDIFYGLGNLQAVFADNYKLCCRLTLPKGFNLINCQAPVDEVSSCESLLRSNVYRAFLAMFALLALFCNLVSFVFRAMSKKSASSSFGVFVIHLCTSDFLMGLYLAMIGVADWMYQGTYLWEDMQWRHSVPCHMAGFLSLLSNEVSTFIICLITLDRFLVLRFPFSQLHFHKKSSHVTCALLWCTGIMIATIPLLPLTSHWDYYSQTGICIPLPITRKRFAGQKYSFTIMIVLNLLLFLIIALGQCIIYWSIRANSMASTDTSNKSKDHTIARRLITIAMSDFLCWFPIGLLGLLAHNDYPVPSEFNVAIAIIVMPLNSTLNPFLYTLNVILDRRQREREDRLYKRLMSQIQQKAAKPPCSN